MQLRKPLALVADLMAKITCLPTNSNMIPMPLFLFSFWQREPWAFSRGPVLTQHAEDRCPVFAVAA